MRFLKKIAILSFICSSFVAIYFLLCQPWFSFGRVYITGVQQISRQDILSLTGLKEPVNLFLVDKKNIEHILANDLRIKKADVYYELPNVLHINITEETPLFYAKSNYGFVSVNNDCVVIGATKNIKDALAPVVTGISSGNSFVGDRLAGLETNFAKDFLDALDAGSRSKVSELNITGGKAKIFDLAGRPYIIGEMSEAGKKAAAFCAIIKEITEKNLAVEFVDLSYSKPYIKIKQQQPQTR